MVPLLSASTSLIMSCNSDSEGFWPSERITVPSSLVVIWPVFEVGVVSNGTNTTLKNVTVGADRMEGERSSDVKTLQY